MATAALFRLDELSSEVYAVDGAANSDDLGGDPTSTPALVIPDTVDSLTGRGRVFGDDIGLQGPELVADGLRLTRDFTIRAHILYEIGNAINGDKGTITARGVRGSAAERLLFGVELERINATTAKISARWEEIGGAAAVLSGVSFSPPPGDFFALGVSREWISTGSVKVTYVVNDVLIGTEVVTDGDIGEGVGGTLTIGCAGDGLGNYENFLPAGSILDQVSIESDAMSYEEIRQDFRRINVHQPNGYRILRSYIPPGESWSKDPASAIQKWIAAEGDGVGFSLAQGEKLREDHLPDRAYGEALEAWENLTGLAPKLFDTIEERRTAVIGALRKILGFTLDALKTALAPLFGLVESDVELVEFGALREDDFSVDDITPAEPSNMWREEPGVGTIAIAAGLCTITTPGASNAQWYKDPTGFGAGPWRETSISGGLGKDPDDAVIVIDVDGTAGIDGVNVLCGCYIRNPAGEVVFFGVLDDGGGYDLHSYNIVGGVRSALVNHGAGGSGVDRVFLRTLGAGLYQVGTVSGGIPTILSSVVAGPLGPRWAGFGVFSRDVVSNAQDAAFDNAQIFEPGSERGYMYLAFRDPLLPGTYNLDKSQAQLDKQDPAHARGIATAKDPYFFELGDGGRLGIDFLFPRYP